MQDAWGEFHGLLEELSGSETRGFRFAGKVNSYEKG